MDFDSVESVTHMIYKVSVPNQERSSEEIVASKSIHKDYPVTLKKYTLVLCDLLLDVCMPLMSYN